MKYFVRNFGVFIIGLGITLSVFEFLLENSGIVLIFGIIISIASYFIKNGLNINISETPIYPGTLIYVPRDYQKLNGVQFVSTLGPIVSSIALSIASLNAINSN